MVRPGAPRQGRRAATGRRGGVAGWVAVCGLASGLLGLAVRAPAAAAADAGGEPSPPSARWKVALQAAAALGQGRLDTGEWALARLSRPRPAAAEAAIALLRALRGDAAGGLSALRSAAARNGAWVALHYQEALLAYQTGDLAAAARALHRAQTLGGDRPRFSMLEALLALRRGQRGRAAAALARLAKQRCDLLDPTLYPDPVTALVRSLGRLLRDFVQPADAEASLGTVLLSLRRFRAAEGYFRRALGRVRGHGAALLGMARLRLVWGDLPGALRYASRAVAQAPRAAAPYALRAEIRILLGHRGAAVADLQQAVRLDPRDALSLNRLGRVLWEQGAHARAERFYEYALKQNPRLAAARFGLGRALARRGAHARALRALRAAAALNPANPAYNLALAVALDRAGKAREAAQARARAQAATRIQRRFEARVRAAMEVGALSRRACQVARRGAPAAVRALLAAGRLPASASALIRAHLALRLGRPAGADAARVAAGLSPSRLRRGAASESTRIVVTGVIAPGVPVRLERYLPFVDPSRLR